MATGPGISEVQTIRISNNPLYTKLILPSGLIQLTWDSPFYISRDVSGVQFSNYIVFLCLKIFYTLTNRVDPDEMQHYPAFHLGCIMLHFVLVFTVCKSTCSGVY